MSSLPVVLSVKVPTSEDFSIQKMLEEKYEMNLLGGQHLVECDTRLLDSVYLYSAPKDIPPAVMFKSASVYQGLTKQEEEMIVTVLNNQVNYSNFWFDKVLERFSFFFDAFDPFSLPLGLSKDMLNKLNKFFVVICFKLSAGNCPAE